MLTPVWTTLTTNIKDDNSTYDGSPMSRVKNIIIGQQVEIKSKGLGDRGQNAEGYYKALAKTTEMVVGHFHNHSKTKKNVLCAVDDNSKHFIRAFHNNIGELASFRSAKFKNTDD